MKFIGQKTLSSTPFSTEIRAIQGLKWYVNKQLIVCSIYLQEHRTILKIESAALYNQSFDAYLHEENIRKLYGELRFRLESAEKPKIDEVLYPDEKIFHQFHPVEYQDIQFESFITNSRLLLSRNKLVFAEINPKRIQDITLEKEWSRKSITSIQLLLIGIIFITIFGIMSLIFLITKMPAVFYFLEISIPIMIFVGLIPIIVGIAIGYDSYLLIQADESIKLFSKKAILRTINTILSEMATGKIRAIDAPPLILQKEEEKSLKSIDRTPEIMKTCPLCGAKNPGNIDFCEKCGAAI
jgi:hypothetical protein